MLSEQGTTRIDAEFASHPVINRLSRILAKNRWKSVRDVTVKLTSGHTPYLHDVSTGDVGFITIESVKGLEFDEGKVRWITTAHYESEFAEKRVTKGSVICTIKRRICQAFPFVDEPTYPLAINQDIALLMPTSEVQPAYLAAYLSSAIGQAFADRQKTEQMNPYISVENLSTLPVVILSEGFQSRITGEFIGARKKSDEAITSLAAAEKILLHALGLDTWQPPEPLTYVRRASEVEAAARFDSEFFAPRTVQLLAKLGAGGRTIRDVAPPRHDEFKSAGGPDDFDYIEIGSLHGDGTVGSERMACAEAPSRATWHVRGGDVVTSTVRPNRRLSALITSEQTGFVASSGFVVLRPQAVPAEVLLTYLRLPPVCKVMDLHTSASLYPTISETDLLKLPFPKLDAQVCTQVTAAVRAAHTARREAQALLARAQRAVEVAIEQGEPAAMALLS